MTHTRDAYIISLSQPAALDPHWANFRQYLGYVYQMPYHKCDQLGSISLLTIFATTIAILLVRIAIRFDQK